jgi:hypothetical protein
MIVSVLEGCGGNEEGLPPRCYRVSSRGGHRERTFELQQMPHSAEDRTSVYVPSDEAYERTSGERDPQLSKQNQKHDGSHARTLRDWKRCSLVGYLFP